MGGLSRRTKGSGKTCIPVRCVLGYSPSCQGVQSVHRNGLCRASLCCTLHFPEVALFLDERSYCISVKVQHKGLFEKQGLKSFLLQQLWASCDWQTQSPCAIWCWVRLKTPNWYAACHIKMSSRFTHFHCKQGVFQFSLQTSHLENGRFPRSKKKKLSSMSGTTNSNYIAWEILTILWKPY